MRETCNTCGEGTAYIRIDQCHLGCLIVIFIMHILDQVQCIYIDICKPIHHCIILLHNLIIIKVLRSNWLILWSNLYFILLVNTTVDRIEETFCKVCSGAEELHLLTGLCCRYTTADCIIITPYRLHDIIILILDRAGLDGDVCCISLEVLRKIGGVKYRDVWLRSRSHILQGMKNTIICLCHHMTTVYTDTGKIDSSPYRISGEKLVVRLNTCKLDHTELHGHVIDELLCLFLCQCAVL